MTKKTSASFPGSWLSLLVLLGLAGLLPAQFKPREEPRGLPNLTLLKEKLTGYHDCTCDCGCYRDDLASVGNKALAYLKHYLQMHSKQNESAGRKPAIVLDIDETALSNWENIKNQDFAFSRAQFVEWQKEARAPAIAPTLALFNFAHENALATFFITGRSESLREATVRDLESAGYKDWTGLIMRQPDSPKLAADFKSAERKKLRDGGYVVVINVGDQVSDLAGEPALKSFKLPNPFYYVR